MLEGSRSTFTDMSEHNLLHPCSSEKPELYQQVRLYFEDDHETTGHWTGRFWWSSEHETAPLFWQNLEAHQVVFVETLHGSRN